MDHVSRSAVTIVRNYDGSEPKVKWKIQVPPLVWPLDLSYLHVFSLGM